MTEQPWALVPAPDLARSTTLLEEIHEAVAGLRSLDPTLPLDLVAPASLQEKVKPALELLGYAQKGELELDKATTLVAGIPPDRTATFLGARLDRYELRPAARPLHAVASFLSRPRGSASLMEHARLRARAETGLAQACDRIARETDPEGLVLSLQSVSRPLDVEAAAYVRHRAASAALSPASVVGAARALRADARAGISYAAREALGYMVRLLFSSPGGAEPARTASQAAHVLASIEGGLGRELDVLLADALLSKVEARTGRLELSSSVHDTATAGRPASQGALSSKVGPAGTDSARRAPGLGGGAVAGLSAVVGFLDELEQAPKGARDGEARTTACARSFLKGMEVYGEATEAARLDEAAAALGGLGVTAEQVLALALADKYRAKRPQAERRRRHRRLARALDAAARRRVESVLPELAGADRAIEDGLAAEAKAGSRAELVSARRRGCALALARTAELVEDAPGPWRSELERTRALLETARKTAGDKKGSAGPGDADRDLVALAVDEAMLPPDADRGPLVPRARAAIERWAASPERAPLGFLGAALRLMATSREAEPFPGEARDPRRLEARALYHLTRRQLSGSELPRDLVEALMERRRSGVQLSDLAFKLDPTVASALIHAGLPQSLAARLTQGLGKADEVRLVRRLRPSVFLGYHEGRDVTVRFYPEDEPPIEKGLALVAASGRAAGGALVARPLAALDAARVRGGLGVGWALVCAHVVGEPLAPEDVPEGPAAFGFLADLARSLEAQHARGLVHGAFGLDAIVVTPEGELCLSDWDLEATLVALGSPEKAFAQDLTGLLAAAQELVGDAGPMDGIRSKAGDLAAQGAVSRVASLLGACAAEAGAASHDALAAIRARRTVDRSELRALLRDGILSDGIPHSLAEIEARVPPYLLYRAAIHQETLRDEILEVAEEGWVSGEATLEVDATRGSYRLVEAGSS